MQNGPKRPSKSEAGVKMILLVVLGDYLVVTGPFMVLQMES